MSKNRRSMFKDGLTESVKHSFETKDSYGEGSDYLKKGVKVQKWIPKHTVHIVDFLPYIAGPNCPNQREGKATHVLDVWVHQRVGPSDASVICMAKTFKLPCPICDLQKKRRQEGALKDELDKLQAKRRTLYWVIVRDTPEEEKKGIQLWEVSFHFMEKKLAALAKNPRHGGFTPFADFDEGKSVSFSIEKAGENKMEYIGHQFIDRDTPISDEEVDFVYDNPLDGLIHIPTIDEVTKLVDSIINGSSAKNDSKPSDQDTDSEESVADDSYSEGSDDAPWSDSEEEKDYTGSYCGVCGEPQYATLSGVTCDNGHGGADSVENPEDAEEYEGHESTPEPEPEPEPEKPKQSGTRRPPLKKEEAAPTESKPASTGRRPLPRNRQ